MNESIASTTKRLSIDGNILVCVVILSNKLPDFPRKRIRNILDFSQDILLVGKSTAEKSIRKSSCINVFRRWLILYPVTEAGQSLIPFEHEL